MTTHFLCFEYLTPDYLNKLYKYLKRYFLNGQHPYFTSIYNIIDVWPTGFITQFYFLLVLVFLNSVYFQFEEYKDKIEMHISLFPCSEKSVVRSSKSKRRMTKQNTKLLRCPFQVLFNHFLVEME